MSWGIVVLYLIVCAFFVLFWQRKLEERRIGALANSIAAASELRSPFLTGNCESICKICGHIGQAVGLSARELRALDIATKLCDVGLASLPTSILRKNWEWTEEEETQYDQHPINGANILRRIKPLKVYADIVEKHHARLIECKDQPRDARIIALASDYVRLRKTMGHQRAMTVIHKLSGKYYDSLYVEALQKASYKIES